MRNLVFTTVFALVSFSGFSFSLSAQESVNSIAVEEIIVTARKRS